MYYKFNKRNPKKSKEIKKVIFIQNFLKILEEFEYDK